MHDELVGASNLAESAIPIDDSVNFLNKCSQLSAMFGAIEILTKGLQKDGITLAECTDSL